MKSSRPRAALLLISLATALVGIATLTVAGIAAAAQDRVADHQMDARTGLVAQAVSEQLHRYVDALSLVAAGLGAVGPPTATTFRRTTEPLQKLALNGVPAIAFIVPAGDDQIALTQARWRARGSKGLTLVPNDGTSDHFFTVLKRSLDGSQPPPLGGDSTRAPAAAQAMRQAAATGRVTVSVAYELLRDRGLPPGQRQLSVVVAAPVRGDGRPGRVRPLHGWVVMSLRGQNFMTGTLQAVSQHLLDVTLLVRDSTGRPVTVASLRAGGSAGRDLHRALGVQVAQATWTIRVDAVAARLPGVRTTVPEATGVVGLLVTLLAATLIVGRARADTRVRVATAHLVHSSARLQAELAAREAAETQLRAAHDDLAAQRTRLIQVLNALDISVLTCDRDGAITHLNGTARDRLGRPAEASTIAEHAAYLNLTHPDRTPLRDSQLPLRRSLRGEEVDDLEVIAEPASGGRRVLRMQSRPLHDPNGVIVGAVASAYDITALREHEAELTAFAGVVAHDLKAPLTAISGFARLALTGLTGGQPLDRPLAHLRHVVEATQRMDRLIEELLRHAAARDARLELAEVDLRTLVDRAIADRVVEPATGPETPPPEIFVGPLPRIRADAALMRQLIDNLIGNSFKYTPPGQPVRLDITAEATDRGELHLTVADRGIGIPGGQHRAIFTSFYRSDHCGAYPGHGLGLSICQRIAQRHGGTISAQDNPGGGTRIIVVLPTAGMPAGQESDPRPSIFNVID